LPQGLTDRIQSGLEYRVLSPNTAQLIEKRQIKAKRRIERPLNNGVQFEPKDST